MIKGEEKRGWNQTQGEGIVLTTRRNTSFEKDEGQKNCGDRSTQGQIFVHSFTQQTCIKQSPWARPRGHSGEQVMFPALMELSLVERGISKPTITKYVKC